MGYSVKELWCQMQLYCILKHAKNDNNSIGKVKVCMSLIWNFTYTLKKDAETVEFMYKIQNSCLKIVSWNHKNGEK